MEQKNSSKKRKSFRVKKRHYLIIIIAIVVLVLLALFFLLNTPSYAFSYEKNGALFASNVALPNVLMQKMFSKDTFVVSITQVADEDISLSANNFLIPFLVVLVGNDKNAVSLIQVFDTQNTLLSCESNLGDVLTHEMLSAEQCTALLNDPSSIKIVLNPVNSLLQKPTIIFSENRIELTPKNMESIKSVSYALLIEMFPNYAEIINQANFVSSYVIK